MDPPLELLEGKKSSKSTTVDEESLFADHSLAECLSLFTEHFVNFPIDGMRSPLDLECMQCVQFDDDRPQARRQQCPELFPVKCIDNVPILCC